MSRRCTSARACYSLISTIYRQLSQPSWRCAPGIYCCKTRHGNADGNSGRAGAPRALANAKQCSLYASTGAHRPYVLMLVHLRPKKTIVSWCNNSYPRARSTIFQTWPISHFLLSPTYSNSMFCTYAQPPPLFHVVLAVPDRITCPCIIH